VNYVITGASGLVGAHFMCKLLNEGHSVVALYNSEGSKLSTKSILNYYSCDQSKLKWDKLDLINPYQIGELIKECDVVIHCAAMVLEEGNKIEMYRFNLKSTTNIVNQCLIHNKKLIYMSSVATLGSADNIDINTKWNSEDFNSNYAISKYSAELEYFRGVEEGLKGIIVKPSIILGPCTSSQSGGVIYKSLQNGLKYYPSGSNGFIDVRDVVDASLFLFEKKKWNEPFLLSFYNKSWKDLFENICKELKIRAPFKPLSMKLLKVAIVLEKIRSIILFKPARITKSTAYSSYKKRTYSSNEIQDLGFKPRNFEECIENIGGYIRN
jgi:dihydroflavonol-4-reductase